MPILQVNGKSLGRGMRSDDYETITDRIMNIAGPDVPVISLLEGGYTPEALQAGLFHHCRSLFTH